MPEFEWLEDAIVPLSGRLVEGRCESIDANLRCTYPEAILRPCAFSAYMSLLVVRFPVKVLCKNSLLRSPSIASQLLELLRASQLLSFSELLN
jgi:hypothetical protein